MYYVIVAIVYLTSVNDNIRILMSTEKIYENKISCMQHLNKNKDRLADGLEKIFDNIHNINITCVDEKKALEFKKINDKKFKNITYTN
tara:strand:- start:1945 stop:2208 length:264 start_codon:yes stop_codon:yes gene_type:complete